MCGIFGAVNLAGFFTGDDYSLFSGLSDLVQYRGPDAGGVKVFNTREDVIEPMARFNIFLGHRRLSIIDLSSAANQPFTDGEGLWIVYNGEIFNYVELREDLKRKGHRFRTDSDTEVILKVYEEYGECGFEYLNGMWAFAIVDTKKGRIVLSRDRFSIKPLYVYRSGNAIYFSSEIKQLLPLQEKRAVNIRSMHAFLRQGLLDFNEETLFEDIQKVRPKHNFVMDLETGQVEEKRYWDYFQEDVPRHEGDVLALFREIFLDAVKIRLRSDVPVGCLLSGGLDSSSIAVTADKMVKDGIECFSVIAEDREYSEEKFIDIVRERNHLRVVKLGLKGEAAWEDLEKVVWHHDEPFGGFSIVAQNQILKLVRENSNITVLLSGQGGDEVLCGYKKFFFFYIQELLKRGNVYEIARLVILSFFLRTVVRQFSLANAKRYVRILQHERLDPLKDTLVFRGELEPIWEAKNTKARQSLDIDKYSVPSLAHHEDRNSMAYSLEVRHPFLDHRLVNYMLSIPSSLIIRNGWTKYILRKSIHELPDGIAWRRDKQGFVTPEESWIRNEFRSRIVGLFKTSRLHDFGLIRKRKLMELYQGFVGGKVLISAGDISRFITAEIWAKRFFG